MTKISRNNEAAGPKQKWCSVMDVSRGETEEELKSLLMRVKEESEKPGLQLNIQETKIIASSPIIHGKYMGKQWKQWETLFWGAPKSLQMETAAVKLKDACSLEEKLWPT